MQLENLINCRISETTNHPKTTTNKPVFPNKLILLESEKVASPKAFLMTDQSNQSNTNHTDFEDHTTNLCEIKRLDDNYYSDNGKKYSCSIWFKLFCEKIYTYIDKTLYNHLGIGIN